MNISEIHNLVNLYAGKTASKFFKPTDIDLALKAAQETFVMERLGNPAQYQPNGQVARNGYPGAQKIHNDLRLLVVNASLAINGSGISTIPADFLYHIGFVANSKEVETLDLSEFEKRRFSSLLAPSVDYPIACYYNTTIQFYPITITNITINYLKKPATPVFAYTYTNSRPVYNSGGSTQLDFPDNCHNEIIVRAMQILGINTKDVPLIQYSEQKEQIGI
ncbi:MAG: hypothetical protein ACRC78_21680 [Planktothrix sp.]